MEEYNRSNGARGTIGGILILLGALFLLKSMDIIDYNIGYIIFSGPFVLFVIGVLILINTRKKFLGTILTLIGGGLLTERIFPFVEIGHELILSIAVILLGFFILFKHRRRGVVVKGEPYNPGDKGDKHWNRNSDQTINNDIIDDVAIFGGGQRIVYSDNFKGGSITAIFGGSEINLHNCKLADGVNTIDILALFGGAEIRVPRDWHVVINATPIFGGFSNKIIRDPAAPVDTTKTLVIKGLAMFGGIEVNSKPNY